MNIKTKLLPFSRVEVKSLKFLGLIASFRMLGLFMLLPVLALYAEQFSNASPTLIGIAIGIYALTQAILQIPFGIASDKVGRKKIIILGLIIFAFGSILGALAQTITMLIIARALQGAGAIAAVSMALLADLTREEVRVRAMATLGITIGFSFVLAIVLGPLLNSLVGVSGIFWLTAVFASLAVFIVIFKIPNPLASKCHSDAQTIPKQFGKVIKDKELLKLNLGIFSLHLVLTAVFVALPSILKNTLGLEPNLHGFLYLGVMFISVIFMLPLVIIAETKNKMKQVFILAVFLLIISQLGSYWFANNLIITGLVLVIFFIGFNLLESILPSLISKSAPLNSKGTAMGIYSSAQFFGAFIGGFLGGLLIELSQDLYIVFLLNAVVLIIWLGIAFSMKKFSTLGTMLLKVGIITKLEASELSNKLLQIIGVKQVVINEDEGVAFIKIDNNTINRGEVLAFSQHDFKEQ